MPKFNALLRNFEVPDVPQQPNGMDCGLYAMMYMHFFHYGAPVNIDYKAKGMFSSHHGVLSFASQPGPCHLFARYLPDRLPSPSAEHCMQVRLSSKFVKKPELQLSLHA